MSTELQSQVLNLLDDVLSLDGRAQAFNRDTPLLGAIPELDSMAVLALLTAFEEQLGLVVDDSELDGSVFATVGSLTDFLAAQLG
jgi:acyl carrier protein